MMRITRPLHTLLICLLIGSLLFGSFIRITADSNYNPKFWTEVDESQSSLSPSRGWLQSLPAAYEFEVPYYQQLTNVWCGPASLEMLFDYYGPDITQSDVALVAGTDSSGTYTSDMIRAAHYSYYSDTTDIPPDGYSVRRFGYAAYWHQWSGTYAAISESVKTLLVNDIPLLVLTYYDDSHSTGHYRVLKGYDDVANDFILHDPWNSGTYHGPDETINQSLFINDLWTLYSQWGMIIQPWILTITPDTPHLIPNQTFTITADITCSCPAPFSLTQYSVSSPTANLTLPANFTIVSGPTPALDLSTGSASVQWVCQAPLAFTQVECELEVVIYGSVSGVGFHAGSYTDMLGVNGTISLPLITPTGGFPPFPIEFLVVVVIGIVVIVVIAVVIILIRRRKTVS